MVLLFLNNSLHLVPKDAWTLDIIYHYPWTFSVSQSSQFLILENCLSEQIISTDKHLSIFPHQMEAIVYIFLCQMEIIQFT